MGAWGIQTFQDDAALDWLAELRSADDGDAYMRATLSPPQSDDYLEYDACCAILACGEVLAAALGASRPGLPVEASEAVQHLRNSGADLPLMAALAAERVRRVLADNAELHELWKENTSDYPAWRAGVEELERLLSAI